jgi:predicted nucleotidyltransferase
MMPAMASSPPTAVPDEDVVSSVERLEKQVNASWKTLAKGRRQARKSRAKLVEALARKTSSDLSIVVFGSLARDEFTRGSDVDWTLLVDGAADSKHFDLAREIRRVVGQLGMKQPGREGVFGAMTFSHELIHLIGGEDDTNRNTTRRVLLLLESVALGHTEAHERVVTGALSRYLLEERTFARGSKPLHVPRFLLNDFARYWRTMAVDFAYKSRTRFGKGDALRNFKLRMSRKLIFVSGLLSCFACQLGLAKAGGHTACPGREEECVDCLRAFMRRKPLEVLAETALRLAERSPAKKARKILAAAKQAVAAYDEFLAILANTSKRDHLDNLPQDAMDSDPRFQEARAISHQFRDGIDAFFFNGDSKLASLTRRYGVF